MDQAHGEILPIFAQCSVRPRQRRMLYARSPQQ
jgi:hypothetical protein